MAVFQFIEGFYNPSRRHSALGYLYGPAKCKVGAHSVAWDALTKAANANYQARKYAESLPLD